MSQVKSLRDAARLAAMAYRPGTLLAEGSTSIQSFRGPLVNGFVVREKGHVVVVFRGTRDLDGRGGFDDWAKVNLRATAVGENGGLVHAGFWDAWKSVREAIGTLIAQGNEPIRLVGHSMGGAIAMVAGAALEIDGKPISEVISFGAPAAADSKFLAGVSDRVIRVENALDVVPLLPPRDKITAALLQRIGLGNSVSSDFRHVGRLAYLDDGGIHDGRPHAALVAAEIGRVLLSNGFRDGVAALVRAHAIQRYEAVLSAAAAAV